MIDMLKRRNVNPQVLELAKEFKCSVCSEKKQVQPRHLSSLEVLPPKWHTVSADVGHWRHPGTGEHVQFMLVIDEGFLLLWDFLEAGQNPRNGGNHDPTEGDACALW